MINKRLNQVSRTKIEKSLETVSWKKCLGSNLADWKLFFIKWELKIFRIFIGFARTLIRLDIVRFVYIAESYILSQLRHIVSHFGEQYLLGLFKNVIFVLLHNFPIRRHIQITLRPPVTHYLNLCSITGIIPFQRMAHHHHICDHFINLFPQVLICLNQPLVILNQFHVLIQGLTQRHLQDLVAQFLLFHQTDQFNVWLQRLFWCFSVCNISWLVRVWLWNLLPAALWSKVAVHHDSRICTAHLVWVQLAYQMLELLEIRL